MTKLESANAALARLRTHDKTIKQGLAGVGLSSLGGGLAALVQKYSPLLWNSPAGDEGILLLTDLAASAGALWSGESGWIALAQGYNGFVSGSSLLKILP